MHWKIVATWINTKNLSQWKSFIPKRKACQYKLTFFTVEKRQKSDGNLVEEFQYLKQHQISWNQSIPNTKNHETTLIMRMKLPFEGWPEKESKDNNNYLLLTKWTTKIKFPNEILFWLQQALHCTSTDKNLSQGRLLGLPKMPGRTLNY